VPNHVVVEQVLRKMRGGAQSQLALCKYVTHYIIKCPNNPQGPNVLANELIASALMGALDLPTPRWRLARHSSPFGCEFELGGKSRLPHSKCDLHFASELLKPSSKGRLYSYLPSSFVQRIENRRDFLGALVFDVWAGSTDVRQAVYVEDHTRKTFKAVFIDNGHLFGGPNWDFVRRPGDSICLEKEVYADLFDPLTIESWISRIGKKVARLLPTVLRTVPAEWYKGDIMRLEDTLLARASSLGTLFLGEMASLKVPLQRSYRGINDPKPDSGVLFERARRSWCTPRGALVQT